MTRRAKVDCLAALIWFAGAAILALIVTNRIFISDTVEAVSDYAAYGIAALYFLLILPIRKAVSAIIPRD